MNVGICVQILRLARVLQDPAQKHLIVGGPCYWLHFIKIHFAFKFTMAIFDEITEVFRKSWTTYQKVLAFNHLNHNEIIAAFRQELQAFDGNDNIAVLDIGIGDAWLPTKLLSLPGMPTNLRLFVGVDSSAEPLTVARSTARIPARDIEFIQSDMSNYLRNCPANSFNIVMSSYAIHHLDTAGKASLCHDIYRSLAPGGIVLWADVYNHVPGSTREEVMVRWEERFMGYEGMTLEEKIDIWNHVSIYDLPEDLVSMQTILENAGFVDFKTPYDDGFYSIVVSARKPL